MELEQLPSKVTHAVEGLRDRAAGAVSSDAGSVFRELSGLGRRIDELEESIEDTLAEQISMLSAPKTGTSWPRRLFWMLVGAGVGMGVEYLMDPDRGKDRRAELSDQAASRAREASEELQKKAKTTAERVKGQAIEAAKEQLPETAETDPKLLEQKIKSQVFGHRDDVQDVVLRIDAPGTVAVKGTVPTADSERELIAQVAEVDGVVDVRSELTIRSA